MNVTLDERTRSALGRLTESEKTCLRRRLLPQTAKEMAIDLGVSPHAIEKRLKMARTKLGLSSSLEAARLLAVAESQLPVPQPSDLSPSAEPRDADATPGGKRRWIIGGTAMGITIAAALALQFAGGTAPPQDKQPRIPATPEKAAAFLGESFDLMDRNKSGFLDPEEAPRTAVRIRPKGGPTGPMREVDPARVYAMLLARTDRDGDGKISREEYISDARAMIEATGIPANWKPRS